MRTQLGLALALLLVSACGGASPIGAASPGGGGVLAATGLLPGTRSDRVLVKLQASDSLSTLLAAHGSSDLGAVPGTGWHKIAVPSGYSAVGFVSHLQQDPLVRSAALDLGIQSPEGKGSTLPLGGILLASQIPTQSEIERIGGSAARARATGAGVHVAVIDTGILSNLEGVSGRIDSGGYDFLDGDPDPTDVVNGLDDDGDGLVDEEYAHGTFVASLVLAVAPNARILPLRALDADGIGTSSAVATAIAYAVDHGVQVINLSLSVPPEAAVIGEAIANAEQAGVEVVAAAGNSGAEDATLPSMMEGALLVAATDPDDVRADFASYGDAVDLSAPGVDLSGAYPASPGTAIWSGSSFATALVTGGFALVRAQHSSWSADQVAARLRTTSAGLAASNPGLDGKLGAGRLDLDAATAP